MKDTVADDILSAAENDGFWGMTSQMLDDEFPDRNYSQPMSWGWGFEALPVLTERVTWEWRYVHNDVLVSEWKPLSEVGTTRASIFAFVSKLHSIPTGRVIGKWITDDLFEDFTGKQQFRCIPV